MVAQEIRRLADSCSETANHIQEVSDVVTGAVDYLSGSAQELADYLGQAIEAQLAQSVRSGQQYRKDAAYIQHSLETFNAQADGLRRAMEEVAASRIITGGSATAARAMASSCRWPWDRLAPSPVTWV